MTWYLHTLLLAGFQPRLHPSIFPTTGLAVVGWALFAFSVGALAGVLIRRVVAALAVTLVVWTGVAFLASTVLRNNYLKPLVTSHPDQLRLGDLQVDQWWQHGSIRVTDAQLNAVLQSTGGQVFNGGKVAIANPGAAGSIDPFQYLTQHGYTLWEKLPAGQSLLDLPMDRVRLARGHITAALGGTIWLVRRRPA